MSGDHFPILIIGAGPAGLSAAIQLSRQGQEALVLERDRVGGLLWNANLVENYPGFPEGISGPDLVRLMQRQADRLQVQVAIEEVVRTSYLDGLFSIETDKRELTSSYLVAATGTSPRKIDLPVTGLELDGRLFYEVYPLLGRKDLRILIIGAGDAAFDYALNLAGKNQVTILNKGREIKALPLLVERAAEHPGITYCPGQPVASIDVTERGSLEILAGENGQLHSYQADYLLAAVGREPDVGFADPSIINNSSGLLEENRLFMIGDLVNGSHRQTAIAVGDGIRTAMFIGNLIQKEER
jgi:thioredoxin reductase